MRPLVFQVRSHERVGMCVNDEFIRWRALGNVIGTARADALRITASYCNYPNVAVFSCRSPTHTALIHNYHQEILKLRFIAIYYAITNKYTLILHISIQYLTVADTTTRQTQLPFPSYPVLPHLMDHTQVITALTHWDSRRSWTFMPCRKVKLDTHVLPC